MPKTSDFATAANMKVLAGCANQLEAKGQWRIGDALAKDIAGSQRAPRAVLRRPQRPRILGDRENAPGLTRRVKNARICACAISAFFRSSTRSAAIRSGTGHASGWRHLRIRLRRVAGHFQLSQAWTISIRIRRAASVSCFPRDPLEPLEARADGTEFRTLNPRSVSSVS